MKVRPDPGPTGGRGLAPLTLVIALLIALVACAPGDDPTVEPGSEGPEEVAAGDVTIVATTSILGDIVGTIVGETAEVEVLMGPGVDPHHFEVSAAQAQVLRDADLVVANGLDLEVQLTGALGSAEEDGAEIFYLARHLDPIRWDDDDDDHVDGQDAGHGDDEDDGHGHGDDDDDGHGHGDDEDDGHDRDDAHDHGPYDPHVWFDPVRTADGVRALGDRLAEVGGEAADDWRERAEEYADELLALDDEIASTLDDVPEERRKLITNHQTLGYLADRYGFEILGTVIPDVTTLAEPGARALRDLADLVDEHDVPAIFAETTAPTRLAEAIAGEADRDVEVVVLDTESLGDEGSGAETYPQMLRTVAERVAAALAR